MNSIIKQRVFWIIILAIVSFVVLLPLLRPGLLVTDDGDWMVIRLSAFYQSLREGQFPVRFLGRLNYSYGYPVANFLYPGFLYIGSIFHIVGLPFQHITELIMIGSILMGAAALFLWLRHFVDERASAIGTISFLCMPYLLYDVFKRGSVGEIMAIGLCLVSLYAIEAKRRWLIAPAIGLLAISHNTLALFFIPVLLGYIVVKKYWSIVGSFVIGVGLSSFFWLPAFFDRHTVLFDSVDVSDPTQYFTASRILLLQGLPFLIAALISIFSREKAKSYNKERLYFLIILCVSTVLASPLSRSVWENTSFARFIQFPYRFLALWIFVGPWFIARLVSSQQKLQSTLLATVAIVALFVFSLQYQQSESIIKPEGFFTTNEGTTTVANEYMPRWARVLPNQRTSKRIEVYKGNAVIVEHHATTEKIHVTINASEESVIQVNTLFYPGWGALLDGKPTALLYDNPNGLMRLDIPRGEHQLFMTFRETGQRFLADVLSGVFFILYIILFIAPLVAKKWRMLFFRKKRHI